MTIAVVSNLLEILFKVLLLPVGWKPKFYDSSVARCCWSLVLCLASLGIGMSILYSPVQLPSWLYFVADYFGLLVWWYGFWMVFFLATAITAGVLWNKIQPDEVRQAYSWATEETRTNSFRLLWVGFATVLAWVAYLALLHSGNFAFLAISACAKAPLTLASVIAFTFLLLGMGSTAYTAFHDRPFNSPLHLES